MSSIQYLAAAGHVMCDLQQNAVSTFSSRYHIGLQLALIFLSCYGAFVAAPWHGSLCGVRSLPSLVLSIAMKCKRSYHWTIRGTIQTTT